MTPKEKAIELVEKYFDYSWTTYNTRKIITQSMTKEAAKYCALIAVDEIIDIALISNPSSEKQTFSWYWQEVKTEIENL